MLLILPLSALDTARACDLDARITTFRAHHGRAPDEDTPLRDWMAVTPSIADWLWATRCLGAPGRVLALTVATRAARRALADVGWDHAADFRPLRAVEAAETVLEAWRSGAGPDEAQRDAAAAAAAEHAAYAAYAAAQRADYLAALDEIE